MRGTVCAFGLYSPQPIHQRTQSSIVFIRPLYTITTNVSIPVGLIAWLAGERLRIEIQFVGSEVRRVNLYIITGKFQ